MTRILKTLAVQASAIILGCFALNTTQLNEYELTGTPIIKDHPVKIVAADCETSIFNEFPDLPELTESPWTDDERLMLAKMTMAEAEGECLEGKCLVVRVILNRLESDIFPGSIEEIISQKNQFSSFTNGRYDKAEPSEEVWLAVTMVCDEGWDESEGALFFDSTSITGTWSSKHRPYLFTVGHHNFYS